jgi:tRNA A-37 threonylcarbamoyl transferase component Bud32
MTPDAEILRTWWREVERERRQLPAAVEPVQQRLVRAVGRGTLPGTGPVFVKVMLFPRLRDRLRYLLRALPAAHEARMLAALRRTGISCPEPVAAFGARRFLVPSASMLVTRALPAQGQPSVHGIARAVAGLLSAGVFHPDLNPGNFCALEGGLVAVLDLQSARIRRRPLSRAARLRVAAKLLAECTPAQAQIDALVQSGVLLEDEREPARQQAHELRRSWLVGRILRCWTTSTEFSSQRTLTCLTVRRRVAEPGGRWIDGGPEILRYWVGDRALEVLEGRKASLGAVRRRIRWLPGKHSIYVAGADPEAELARHVPALLEGFAKFREIRSGLGQRA